MNDLNQNCPPTSDLNAADRESRFTRRAFVKRSSFATVASTAVYSGLIKSAAADGLPTTTTGITTTGTGPEYRAKCGAPSDKNAGSASGGVITIKAPASGGGWVTRTIQAYLPNCSIDSSTPNGNKKLITQSFSVKAQYLISSEPTSPKSPANNGVTVYAGTIPNVYVQSVSLSRTSDKRNQASGTIDLAGERFAFVLELIDDLGAGKNGSSTTVKTKSKITVTADSAGAVVEGGPSSTSDELAITINAVPLNEPEE